MKKILLAVAVLLAATSAFAEHGAEPAALNGGVSISTSGSSVAGSYVNGAGTSYEHADSAAGGSSELSSHSWDGGAKVSTEINTYATTNASGTVSGEGTEQGIVSGTNGSTIYNGSIGFGSTSVTAGGSIMFGEGAVQPVGSEPAVN